MGLKVINKYFTSVLFEIPCIKLIDLALNKILCVINNSENCTLAGNLITNHSINMNCYTIMSGLNENSDKRSISRFDVTALGHKNMYIHDSNQLPSFHSNEFYTIYSSDYVYEKFIFKRLPPPHGEMCQHYSGSIKSREQCLNHIIERALLKSKCLPKRNKFFTYVIINGNYSKYSHGFCSENESGINHDIDYNQRNSK